MAHAQIAGVKPPFAEGLVSGLGILKIPLHDNIAPEHHFPNGLTVPGSLFHGRGIAYGEIFQGLVAHSLPRFNGGALVQGQIVPVRQSG